MVFLLVMQKPLRCSCQDQPRTRIRWNIPRGYHVDKISDHEMRTIGQLVERRTDQWLIGVNLRQWFHFGSSLVPYRLARAYYQRRAEEPMSQFVRAVMSFVSHLRQDWDAKVVLISSYQPGVEPWEDDLPWLRRGKAQFASDNDVIVADSFLSIMGFCALISKLDLMVGTRLHSSLTALRVGVQR